MGDYRKLSAGPTIDPQVTTAGNEVALEGGGGYRGTCFSIPDNLVLAPRSGGGSPDIHRRIDKGCGDGTFDYTRIPKALPARIRAIERIKASIGIETCP